MNKARRAEPNTTLGDDLPTYYTLSGWKKVVAAASAQIDPSLHNLNERA